jgi:magnesium-protoporphyrin O-methyltransferase
MLKAIRSLGLHEATLLDIGGGVGVLHHELLQDFALTATHVDASSAYLSAAREAAARLGHAARVEFIHADFTDIASSIPEADVVTLDRVVCCYPDSQRLLVLPPADTGKPWSLPTPARLGMYAWSYRQSTSSKDYARRHFVSSCIR